MLHYSTETFSWDGLERWKLGSIFGGVCEEASVSSSALALVPLPVR